MEGREIKKIFLNQNLLCKHENAIEVHSKPKKRAISLYEITIFNRIALFKEKISKYNMLPFKKSEYLCKFKSLCV